MSRKVRSRSHQSKMITQYKRLDRAITDVLNVSSLAFRENTETNQSFSKNKISQYDSDTTDLYLTLLDPNNFDSGNYLKNINEHRHYLSRTTHTDQSVDMIGKITRTTGNLINSIKKLVTVKAYSRPYYYAQQHQKRYHEQKAAQELDEMPIFKLKKAIEKTEKIHKVQIEKLFDLYKAKCFDNLLTYQPEQAVRFIDRFRKLCGKGNLNFSHLGMGPESLKILSTLFNSHFNQLDLSENVISDQGFENIYEGIRTSSLIHINISRTVIDHQIIYKQISHQAFINLLKKLPKSLISIDLSENRLNQQSFEAFSQFLSKHQLLQFLNLRGCGSTVVYIYEGLKATKNLCSLNISQNPLNRQSDVFFEVLVQLNELTELNLADTSLNSQSTAILGDLIEKQRRWNVLKLSLKRSSIQVEELSYLIKALAHSNLTHLDLSKNDFSHESFFSVIAELFQSTSSLKELDLSECNLNSRSSVGFENMKRAKSLKKVHLMGNLFNNETDRGLSSGISNLTYLDLSKCNLGSRSAILLINSLERQSMMEELILSDNGLDDEFFSYLLTVIRRLTKLQKLDVSRNQYEYKTVETIEQYLDVNRKIKKEDFLPKMLNKRNKLKQFESKLDSTEIEEQFLSQKKEESEQNLEIEKLRHENEKTKIIKKTEMIQELEKKSYEEVRFYNNYFSELNQKLREDFSKLELVENEYQENIKKEIQKQKDLIKLNKQMEEEFQKGQIKQIDWGNQINRFQQRIEQLNFELSKLNRNYNTAYLQFQQAEELLKKADESSKKTETQTQKTNNSQSPQKNQSNKNFLKKK